MDQQILVQLAEHVRHHPWWLSRTWLTRWALRREGVEPGATVLDAGCGWGATYLALERDGYQMTGLDVSHRMLERLDLPGRRLVVGDIMRPMNRSEKFDAVLAMDVIEHIDDDVAACRQLLSLTRPGGILLLSVPALPELFSEFDEIQQHRRRYTAESLDATLQSAGCQRIRLMWWGQLMVWMIRRQRAEKKTVPGEALHETYLRYLAVPGYPARLAVDAAFWVDRWITRLGLSRTGTSLLALVMRPTE